MINIIVILSKLMGCVNLFSFYFYEIMFKAGDKVKVLDDNQKGEVLRTFKNRITIINEFGFEETYNANELIPDMDFEVGEIELPKTGLRIIASPVLPSAEPKEVDLHIGQLVDYYTGLTHYEMLQIQLQKVKDEIEIARTEKRTRLIFIHGHGSGKLKKELIKLLESYDRLEFYDASFKKYKLGATEVKLN